MVHKKIPCSIRGCRRSATPSSHYSCCAMHEKVFERVERTVARENKSPKLRSSR